MKFESKYNFGDTVYSLEKLPSSKWEECSVCNGTAKVEIKGKRYACPECNYRGGKHVHIGNRWKVSGIPKTIERISVELYSPKYKGMSKEDNYSYMCEETGVGSGTVWYQNKLFESKEKAEQRCEQLNSIIENKRRNIRNGILSGRTVEQFGVWSELERQVNEKMQGFDGTQIN